MPDIIDGVAAANAEKTAVIQGDRTWTYAEHNGRANALARALAGMGLGRGDRAIWVSPNDERVLVWGHAARKLGLISVPLNYRFTPDEMTYVIDNSDARLVFCHPDWHARLDALDTPKVERVLDFDESEELMAAEDPSPLEDAPEGLGASMIYTSGTTGKPKGALRSGTDPVLVGALVGELGLSSDDVHITTGPLYHSGPAAFAGLTHLLGGTIVVLERFEPETWLELVERHGASTTFTAPTQLKRIVSLPEEVRSRYDTSSLRVVIANAAPVPYALKEQWVAAFGDDHLFEVYGSTELGVDTVLKPEDQLRKPGSCGKPYGGIEIRIIREDGTEADVGEPGVMWIRSTAAFDAYHKRPDATDETKLEDDPDWRTVGDIAYRDEEGYFHICDRRNDMIISGGMNIYPAEIEGILHGHPAVMDAAVFGIPSEEWGESVHAVIQLKRGAEATAGELEALCREHLASYKIPRSWEFQDELPRTDSGKLLKRVLRDAYWSGGTNKV